MIVLYLLISVLENVERSRGRGSQLRLRSVKRHWHLAIVAAMNHDQLVVLTQPNIIFYGSDTLAHSSPEGVHGVLRLLAYLAAAMATYEYSVLALSAAPHHIHNIITNPSPLVETVPEGVLPASAWDCGQLTLTTTISHRYLFIHNFVGAPG